MMIVELGYRQDIADDVDIARISRMVKIAKLLEISPGYSSFTEDIEDGEGREDAVDVARIPRMVKTAKISISPGYSSSLSILKIVRIGKMVKISPGCRRCLRS